MDATNDILYLNIKDWVNGRSSSATNLSGMLNKSGKSCCLGQFAIQAEADIDVLRESGTPGDAAQLLGYSYDSRFVSVAGDTYTSSCLATRLIGINDYNDCTAPELEDYERAEHIKNVLAKHGITLVIRYATY